ERPSRPGERRPVPVQKAAVPSARPLTAQGRLQHGNARRRLELPHCERGPEPCIAAADDRNVDVELGLERRLRLGLRRLLKPPGRQCSIRSQASSSTSPRILTSSSNSASPATSGGEIWITGSPRSSARQISPRSKSPGERNSRSSRSPSTSENVSRVSLFLTSSSA